jgi:hypothetical protein
MNLPFYRSPENSLSPSRERIKVRGYLMRIFIISLVAPPLSLFHYIRYDTAYFNLRGLSLALRSFSEVFFPVTGCG